MLSWSPIEGAMLTSGSRATAIDAAWRMVPEGERTPIRRKFVIALVDHVREHRELTGLLAPAPMWLTDAKTLSDAGQPEVHCDCGRSYVGAECYLDTTAKTGEQ